MAALSRLLSALVATALAGAVLPGTPAAADVPWPSNPRPCDAAGQPAECIPATDFHRYNRTRSDGDVVRPDDFADSGFTSERTGRPDVDNNPQELMGVKGISLDLAYRTTTGRPEVVLASYDSGYQFDDDLDITGKLWVNRGELPVPAHGAASSSDPYDRDGNGIFTALPA